MKLKYKHSDEFLIRMKEVTRNNIKKPKGRLITTDEEEVKIINKILNPIIKLEKLEDYLI